MIEKHFKQLQSYNGWYWLGLGVLLVSGLGSLLWLNSEHLLYLLGRAAEARTFIQSFGRLAPVAYISLFALQIILAPLPGQFLGVMGGYLFGVFWGSLYSVTGLAVGAGTAMFLARRFGLALLDRFFDRAQVRQWEGKLRMRSPVMWGLLFLFPVPDVVFYLAGLSSLRLSHLLVAIILGRGLGLIFANILGSLTAHLSPEWIIAKWLVVLVGALLIYRYQRKIRLGLLLSVRRIQQCSRRWQRQWLRTYVKCIL